MKTFQPVHMSIRQQSAARPPFRLPNPSPVSSPAALDSRLLASRWHPASRGGAGVLLLPPHSLTGEHPNPSHPASASSFVSSPPLAPIPILRGEVAPGVLLLPPHRRSPVSIPPYPHLISYSALSLKKVSGFNRNRNVRALPRELPHRLTYLRSLESEISLLLESAPACAVADGRPSCFRGL
uniref:Uncharacterized protein n=1 Tax=Oryza meridionalis TaxID=40149 RepID=A0A0E0E7U6_9ORYZ